MSNVHRHTVRVGALALAAASALGLVATAAGASTTSGSASSSTTPNTLAGIKAQAQADTTDRVDDLNGAIAKVNAASGLGAGQSTLDGYLGADIAPLQQLDQTIQGDTTYKQALQDFQSIFNGYRVYVLVLPAGEIAADAFRLTTTVLPQLTADATKAQQHVNAQNQAQLQPLIDDLNAQITTATNDTNGLASTVLAFTPAQWNANQSLLGPSRSADQAAQAAVKQARSDVAQIRQILATEPGAAAGTGSSPATGSGTGAATGAHLGRLGRIGTTTTSTATSTTTS